MSEDESFWYVVIFGGIALFTVLTTLVAVGLRRAGDADTRSLRASEVTAEHQDLLVAPDPLWAAWTDTASARSMTLTIRDVNDALVGTVTVPGLVVDGVVRRLDFDGRRYELRRATLTSNWTLLYEQGTTTPLLSAQHTALLTRLCSGDGAAERLRIPVASVFQRFRRVEAGDKEVGKLIFGISGHSDVTILTLPPGTSTLLERVFLMAVA